MYIRMSYFTIAALAVTLPVSTTLITSTPFMVS